jgi:hypothetical protein
LLAHGLWVSPGTPASSTTKTGCHGIVEILLKVALKHQKSLYLISASVDPCTVKPAHAVTSIKQPPVIKNHPFRVLPWKISYQ